MENGRFIDRGDIHYREYPAWMVRDLIVEIGFRLQALTASAAWVLGQSKDTHHAALHYS
jgi:hypothetical protein